MAKSKINLYKYPALPSQKARIEAALKILDLEGAKIFYEKFTQDFLKGNQGPLEYLENILKEEFVWREEDTIRKLKNQAKFPFERTIEDYDFHFPRKINKQLILDLTKCRFVENGENVFLLGPSGVGKTHIGIGLGMSAISSFAYHVRFFNLKHLIKLINKSSEAGYQRRLFLSIVSPKLLIMDEMDGVEVDKNTSEILTDALYERYNNNKKQGNEHRKTATIFTSNVMVSQWEVLFGNQSNAQRIYDRIREDSHIVSVDGDSYRLKDRINDQQINLKTFKRNIN